MRVTARQRRGPKRRAAYTVPKCRHGADLLVLANRIRSAVVLVDHSAEDLPALQQRIQRDDGRLAMIGWPLLAGLVRPVPVIVPHVGLEHRP